MRLRSEFGRSERVAWIDSGLRTVEISVNQNMPTHTCGRGRLRSHAIRYVAIAKSHPGLEVLKAKPKVAQRGAVKDQRSDCVIVMASRNFAKDWNLVQSNPQRYLRQ